MEHTTPKLVAIVKQFSLPIKERHVNYGLVFRKKIANEIVQFYLFKLFILT